MSSAWQKAVERRLGARQTMTLESMCQQFWPDIPCGPVQEALGQIGSEWKASIGLLRPDDRLDAIFRPPPTKNSLRWMQYQMRSSDGVLEISSQLNRRLKANGMLREWGGKTLTVSDFVRAWCGLPHAL
jgi:hypothetical protein